MQEVSRKWSAGFTRRWHCHAVLRDTVDPVDGHSARVAKLALMIKPDLSREALIWALVHDDSEIDLGDISGWAKRNNPELREFYAKAEEQNLKEIGIEIPEVNDLEMKVIYAADKIDCHLWAMFHKPELSKNPDWIAAKGDIKKMLDEFLGMEEVGPNAAIWQMLDYFS